MKVVALMPLKAHSSRVPGKNFKALGGKPLFRWMLDKLLAVSAIDEVVINTDARSELNAAGMPDSPRVVLRDRPGPLCGDEVSMNLILENDLESVPADIYLMTHTTNPFVSQRSIQTMVERFQGLLDQGQADSAFSVTKTQTRFYRADVSPVNHDPDNLIPTQDLEPWFEENSCLYAFTRQSFGQTRARIGAKPTMIEIPAHEAIDIDTPDEWHLAELIAKGMRDG